MATTPKLSDAQIAALKLALMGDGRLYRWPGGAWRGNRPPTPEEVRAGAFLSGEPYTTVQTVRGLETRALLVRINPTAEEWRDPREITAAGRAAVAS